MEWLMIIAIGFILMWLEGKQRGYDPRNQGPPKKYQTLRDQRIGTFTRRLG